jgi:hypothetical protein
MNNELRKSLSLDLMRHFSFLFCQLSSGSPDTSENKTSENSTSISGSSSEEQEVVRNETTATSNDSDVISSISAEVSGEENSETIHQELPEVMSL